MNPAVLGTSSLILAKAQTAALRLQGKLPLPPGCDRGCQVPGLRSCMIDGASVSMYPILNFFTLKSAPPSGSPADFPVVYTYSSNSNTSTELGSGWGASYQRFAEPQVLINPNPLNVNTPNYTYSYSNNGTSYSAVAPNQNTLVGSSATGWTETQPNGTSFGYDTSGVLRTISNRAGVRWTMVWDSAFNFLQAISGPFSRRTSFIPYAAMSATSSNCWKLSVINEASASAYLVVRPSRTSWMAA